MAFIKRIIQVAGEGPGFLLPTLINHIGANQELIQIINESNKVSSLEPIIIDGSSIHCDIPEFDVHVGGQAAWVFRDHAGEIHFGTGAEIKEIGQKLLTNGVLDDYPLVAAEMAAFCGVETDFPNVLKSAFTALARVSKSGAEVWRDAVVLLPLIKMDIKRHIIGLSANHREAIRHVSAITRGQTTHIFAPPVISSLITALPQWEKIAKNFNVHNFKVHSQSRQNKYIERPAWSLFGIGGISRFVICRPPFSGSQINFTGLDAGAIAHEKITANVGNWQTARLILAVVPSNLHYANSLNSFVEGSFALDNAIRHAINIRPSGFGTPRRNNPSPASIRDALSNFDCIWIVANHRQRQTGNYSNSLSAGNTAARFVRSASIALTACLSTQAGRDLLREASGSRGAFGLVGGTRYSSSLDTEVMIRQVLYSMLCEDAHLHSARRIAILWPRLADGETKIERVSLGEHLYSVELIHRPDIVARIGVIGFALDVELSSHTEKDFQDFCISLVAGYGWILRQNDGRSMLLSNEGIGMRIWPVKSISAIKTLLQHGSEFGQSGDLIVTNQTVPEGMRSFAKEQAWGIAHYSELGRWMKTEHKMGVFKDL